MKKLYHGSTAYFDVIDINSGKGYKDFGRGFYATAIVSHADKLALRNKSIEERKQIFLKKKNVKTEAVTAYRYNLIFNEETNDLKVKIFDKADSEWLKFIVKNRKCNGSMHDYDIVIGPTADAETTMIINDYIDELEKRGCFRYTCGRIGG